MYPFAGFLEYALRVAESDTGGNDQRIGSPALLRLQSDALGDEPSKVDADATARKAICRIRFAQFFAWRFNHRLRTVLIRVVLPGSWDAVHQK
mgnify:CR=1 FL=1